MKSGCVRIWEITRLERFGARRENFNFLGSGARDRTSTWKVLLLMTEKEFQELMQGIRQARKKAAERNKWVPRPCVRKPKRRKRR